MGILLKKRVVGAVKKVEEGNGSAKISAVVGDKPAWKKDICRLAEKHYPKTRKKEVQKIQVQKKISSGTREKRKTIDDLWVEILFAAVGKNLTDKEIAAQMKNAATKMTGKEREYNEESVAAHRSGYNCGRFASQKGKRPANLLVKYEPKKKESIDLGK
jgi:hypothetical protein